MITTILTVENEWPCISHSDSVSPSFSKMISSTYLRLKNREVDHDHDVDIPDDGGDVTPLDKVIRSVSVPVQTLLSTGTFLAGLSCSLHRHIDSLYIEHYPPLWPTSSVTGVRGGPLWSSRKCLCSHWPGHSLSSPHCCIWAVRAVNTWTGVTCDGVTWHMGHAVPGHTGEVCYTWHCTELRGSTRQSWK